MFSDRYAWANIVNPDQTALRQSNFSGVRILRIFTVYLYSFRTLHFPPETNIKVYWNKDIPISNLQDRYKYMAQQVTYVTFVKFVDIHNKIFRIVAVNH